MMTIECFSFDSPIYAASTDDITTVDLTDLFTGDASSHDCNDYLVSKYDSTNHWKECSVCKKKFDVVAHNIVDNGWSMGSANVCNPNNKHRFSCSCGYSYTSVKGRKSHHLTPMQNTAAYIAGSICDVCYYSPSGHHCVKSDGSLISCKNLGTCKICGYTYTVPYHHVKELIYNAGDDVYCMTGGEKLCHVNYNYIVRETPTTFKYYVSITVPSGYTFVNDNAFTNDSNVIVSDSVKTTGTTWTNVQTVTYNGYSEAKSIARVGFFYKNAKGEPGVLYIRQNICNDETAPVISSVVQSDASDTEWSKQKTITVTGTENYCRSVKLELQDAKGSVIDKVQVSVSNKKWSYGFKPILEADESGKTYRIVAYDMLDNKTMKTFTVYKTDSKAPVVTSIKSTDADWTKTKKVTFTCADAGAGNVEIAFNRPDDYKPAVKDGDTYSRTYLFKGDVYGKCTGAVYYKDGAGNVTTQFVDIYNLDNTAPTLSSVDTADVFDSDHNAIGWNLVVQSTDMNDRIGTDGSGDIEYAVTLTAKAPSDNAYQTDGSFFMNVSGHYYLWAKDACGNVSMPMPCVIQSDVLFNGKSINKGIYNQKNLTGIYYNGKRLRL